MAANQTDKSPIRVIPAAPENWPDIETLFAHNPCWCQAWRLPSGEFGRVPKGVTKDEHTAWRKEMLRRQLERPVPPGMLAYIDDRIVG